MKKRTLTLALIAVLAAVAIIGGTLAYFTDTKSAKNTFTVGKVGIDLTEDGWENDPVLMPDVFVDKDPVITVKEDSEDIYLFVEIDSARYMGYAQLIAEKNKTTIDQLTIPQLRAGIDEFIIGIEHEKWEVMNRKEIEDILGGLTSAPTHLKLVLGYKDPEILHAGASVQVFEKIGLPAWVTQDMRGYETLAKADANPTQITVSAYAIQAAGFDTLKNAYDEVVTLFNVGNMTPTP